MPASLPRDLEDLAVGEQALPQRGYGTSCTTPLPSRASEAAVAADWARIMKTGSMRIEPYAMWLAESATGTRRFVASARFGTMAR